MSDRGAGLGWTLTVGGLAVLIANELLQANDLGVSLGRVVTVGGVVAGYLVLGSGILMLCRGSGRARAIVGLETSHSVDDNADELHGMLTTFRDWVDAQEPRASFWPGFDQLLREMLADRIGAARVRALLYDADDGSFRNLRDGEPGCDVEVVRRAAATGRQQFDLAATRGAPASRPGGESNGWTIPVRAGERTIGVISIGRADGAETLTPARRARLGLLLSMFWRHVALLDSLRRADTTDKTTGVLTRADFFGRATDATRQAAAAGEPVVVAVLALGGLRTLDDSGRWSERDRLLEELGALLVQRARPGDVCGRFSDDRLIWVLRRVDVGLATLLAEKLAAAVEPRLAELGAVDVRARIGLAGGTARGAALDELMIDAFRAIDAARISGQCIAIGPGSRRAAEVTRA